MALLPHYPSMMLLRLAPPAPHMPISPPPPLHLNRICVYACFTSARGMPLSAQVLVRDIQELRAFRATSLVQHMPARCATMSCIERMPRAVAARSDIGGCFTQALQQSTFPRCFSQGRRVLSLEVRSSSHVLRDLWETPCCNSLWKATVQPNVVSMSRVRNKSRTGVCLPLP